MSAHGETTGVSSRVLSISLGMNITPSYLLSFSEAYKIEPSIVLTKTKALWYSRKTVYFLVFTNTARLYHS